MQNSSWIARALAVAGAVGLLALLAFFLDQPARPVARYSGFIVDTYTPGKWRTGSGTVQVELDNGASVIATVPVLAGFPYPDGTAVTVTAWDSLVFGKRSYEARVPPMPRGP